VGHHYHNPVACYYTKQLSSVNKLHELKLYRVFQKELYNDIPNVAVWPVLRKRLHLKVYKISVVQGVEVRVRFLTLPDFLRSSGSGTGSTQPREYN
jgi:hypothetical protein